MLADTAARSFAAGDSGGVTDAAAGLRIANFFEPHKAPFAEGDGLFLAGDFAAARQRFEEALSLAGTADAAAADKASPQPSERPGQGEVPADPGKQSQPEQLKDSTKKAQSERNSGQERDEYLRDDDFGPGVDRPW